MIEDPGYVPKLGSRSQQKEVVDELLSLWKLDDENFCTICVLRKPLRSKHCKRCGRCVAKHDHHCPWIHNCVGVNNHRHFYLYILSTEIGILILIRLTLICKCFPFASTGSCHESNLLILLLTAHIKILNTMPLLLNLNATFSPQTSAPSSSVILLPWHLPSGVPSNASGSPCS